MPFSWLFVYLTFISIMNWFLPIFMTIQLFGSKSLLSFYEYCVRLHLWILFCQSLSYYKLFLYLRDSLITIVPEPNSSWLSLLCLLLLLIWNYERIGLGRRTFLQEYLHRLSWPVVRSPYALMYQEYCLLKQQQLLP